MSHRVDPGAVTIGSSTCRFVVWATKARRVTLRLVGPVQRDVPLRSGEHGYHEVTVEGIGPGQRYWFRLDNGPDRTDPASRWQPDGVHGPSAVDDAAFDWTDTAWRGLPLDRLVLYELHVGTFTPEGSFDAAITRLDRLVDLGVNAIEIMPVAQFPGRRNWGYDGVYPFAVQTSYGGTKGLKRLVDAAHRRGIAVLLDVVYNHLGPEGNYLHAYGPYFTRAYGTPWGEPFNLDGHGSDAVRDYFLANARRWQEEFHLDGLRLDAVPWIKDFSASHLLADVAAQARRLEPACGRPFHLIGESDLNDPRVIRPTELGGYGLSAQWSDDFHHALHALLTGERQGYYADHGTLDHLARAYRDAFVLTGQYSHYRQRRYGTRADDRPGEQFVIFAQNHDQVGNRPRGERLSTLVDFEALKLAAGLLLTAPYLPMLFMGEEYGEPAPFPFFIDHGDRGLVERIRRGRKHEFAEHAYRGEPYDPADESTFRLARLDVSRASHGHGQTLHAWHRELLRLRRELPALARLDRQAAAVECRAQEGLLIVRRMTDDDAVCLLFHFAAAAARPRIAFGAADWHKTLDSAGAAWQGPGSEAPGTVSGEVELPLAPRSMVLYRRG